MPGWGVLGIVSATKLHIAFLVDGAEVPRWVARAVEQVAAMEDVVVAVHPAAGTARAAPSALTRVWQTLDDRLFAPEWDAARPAPVDPSPCPAPASTRYDVVFDTTAAGASDPPSATHGVWRWSFDAVAGTPPGLAEIVNGADVVASRLVRDDGTVLVEGTTTPHPWSPSRQRTWFLYKASRFAEIAVRDLQRGASPSRSPLPGDRGPTPVGAPPPPRLWRTAEPKKPRHGALPGMSRRWVREVTDRALRYRQWVIGVRHHAPDHRWLDGEVEVLRPPAGHFWADPFVVQHEGRTWLFFEDYPYATRRGEIAVMEYRRGTWTEPVPVLQCPYHLSYPFVLTHGEDWYMIPETSAARRVELYRATAFPHRWEPVEVLLDDVMAADATVVQHEGRWWMFAGLSEEGGSASETLHLYSAPDLRGPWTPHRNNPIKCDARSSRPAGRMFRWRGQLYRPAQDCSYGYGHGVGIHRVEQLDDEGYRETVVGYVGPTWHPRIRGTHTLNRCGNIIVVDGLMMPPKWWRRLP